MALMIILSIVIPIFLLTSLSVNVLPVYADTVLDTIPVGDIPNGAVVNPSTNKVYVSNRGDDTISVIDGSTDAVITIVGPVNVGNLPSSLAINTATNKIYVGGSGIVSVIDGSTDTIVATVDLLGFVPPSLAINPSTNKVYVNDVSFGGVVTVIDGSTDAVITTVGVVNSLENLVINPSTNKIYVPSTSGGGTISVIDGSTDTVITTLGLVGDGPRSLTINPSTNKVYLINDGPSSSPTPRVSIIDGSTDTIIATVPVGNSPQALAINPSINKVYVANDGDNTVSIIDGSTDTIIATVPVGSLPRSLAINTVTNNVYVANSADDTVSIIDGSTDTVISTVAPVDVGVIPNKIAINSLTNKVYVNNFGSAGIVTVIGNSVSSSSAAQSNQNNNSCKSDCTPPTLGLDGNGKTVVSNGFQYNEWVVDVQRYFTPMDLITVNVGEMNRAILKIYENSGPDKIRHVELIFGLGKGETVNDKRASIIWEKSWDGIETLSLFDPENVIGKLNVESSFGSCNNNDGGGDDGNNAGIYNDPIKEKDTQLLQKTIKHDDNICLIITIDHMFREPLEFNMVGTYVWDHNHSGWQNYFNHGIQIQGDSMNPYKTDKIPSDKKGSGSIELTQIDKWNDIWIDDDNGVEYFKNSFGTYIRQTPITMETNNDPNWTVMNRMHSNFDKMVQDEKIRAVDIFDSSKIMSELPELSVHEIPDYQSRWNDDTFVKFIEEQNEIAKQYWDSEKIQGILEPAIPTAVS